tara:strand:+ start:166 stop:348 length:183 start_codon:yes stop_codon:yes gene_type:complete
MYARYSIQEHGEWTANNNKHFELRQAFQAFFSEWDILICPQMATTAFPTGPSTAGLPIGL